jgi:hypothetical protein
MPRVVASRLVELPAEDAVALWTNVGRWPTFIEGFARTLELDDGWPEGGSKLVWESTPAGRGRVTERVLEYTPSGGEQPARLSTQVFEERLMGTQTVSFESAEGGTLVEIALEYELQPNAASRQGLLGKLNDLFFIRNAESSSLERTLRRFATEAAEENAL